MMARTFIIVAGIVLATVIVVAFVQGSGSTPEPGIESVPAPPFTLTDLESGDELTLESYAGEPLVIHFFASWCPLCTGTARNIADYADEADFNVLLVAVDSRESDAELIEFKERIGRDWWNVARLTPDVERSYAVRSLDTKFVIDSDGAISHSDNRAWRAGETARFIGEVV